MVWPKAAYVCVPAVKVAQLVWGWGALEESEECYVALTRCVAVDVAEGQEVLV